MKAAKTDMRPNFRLMKQTDIVSFFHLQMPRWLFSNSKYQPLPLEAKVAYTFLLNRFQLSRLNGWINDEGEVFVIFTRESLAQEMQITYKKAIAAFQSLAAVNLIWEKRVGRGNANQIYLALVELSSTDAEKHVTAPFGNEGTRPADSAPLHDDCLPSRPAETAHQDLLKPPFKIRKNSISAPAETGYPEVPNLHPSKKEKSYNSMSETEKVSPSVYSNTKIMTHGQDEENKCFEMLLEACELWVLPEEARRVFQNAIERLFYSNNFTVGKATLPQARVRRHLKRIDGTVLLDAYQKLRSNTERKVKNSTAYVMSTLFNAIHESESDLLVDPFLNSMSYVPPPDLGRRETS